jgi:hypothetical protein
LVDICSCNIDMRYVRVPSPHDGVAPLGNSYGYYLHDDV